MNKEMNIEIHELHAQLESLRNQESTLNSELEPLTELIQTHQESMEQLKNVRKEHLQEFMAYSRPPNSFLKIASAIALIFGKGQTWLKFVEFSQSYSFKDELLNFDIETLNEDKLSRLSGTVEELRNNETQLANMSMGISCVYIWLRATYDLAALIKRLNPLLNELKSIKESIFEIEKQLKVI